MADLCPSQPQGPETLELAGEFSFYRRPIHNTVPCKEITLLEVYRDIQSTRNQWPTKTIRSITDQKLAKTFKASHFDYVTFSGTFTQRNNQSLIRHSGLLTIDLDHVTDLPGLRRALLNDHLLDTELLFVSPSGNGLKWIVAIDPELHAHGLWFLAIANYLLITYQVEADASGKDLSRACFLPHDPEVYIHPKYLL